MHGTPKHRVCKKIRYMSRCLPTFIQPSLSHLRQPFPIEALHTALAHQPGTQLTSKCPSRMWIADVLTLLFHSELNIWESNHEAHPQLAPQPYVMPAQFPRNDITHALTASASAYPQSYLFPEGDANPIWSPWQGLHNECQL
jgi:hypothetical protein